MHLENIKGTIMMVYENYIVDPDISHLREVSDLFDGL